ncbi:hypothetical protein GCM10011507_22980 [Edaphobacter acidisoli]|uniref:Ice-binding protein C-terminal domain-containing protein n=1 Tax=Edaphobacter acidisoli TaxID=2040573 RepID=A0A916RUV1_9BACT|nr:NF038132 family protein [Edaphobacter acidisoli]GGA70821.1 hypothetical protein GCM10011507_22980 [Edaphobacter acidisoli]
MKTSLPVAIIRFTTLGLALFGLAGISLADPIPSGWTCSGSCGSLGANGVVTLSPTGNSSYEYITTNGSSSTAVVPGVTKTSETNGSTLATPVFSATSGTALNFYFNFVTSDGAGGGTTYADYGWAELFNSSNDPVALLFTGRTEPTGSIVPGSGLPTPVATLTPSSVPIIGGGPDWSPLGGYSGSCFGPGCGYTGWVLSSYTIPTAGNYYLEFGVTNWIDQLYDTGMAIDGVTVGGVPVTPPSTPEPSTLALFGTGLIAIAGAARKKFGSR